jgi:hypothetical protein
MAKRRNIDLLSGTLCVDPKTKWVLELRYLILRIHVLLSKWLFKLLSEEGVWQVMLSNMYLGSKTLLFVKEL